MTNLMKIVIIAVSVIYLTGCGFKPRVITADSKISFERSYLALDKKYDRTGGSLKKTLKSVGINLVEKEDEAKTIFKLSNVQFDSNDISGNSYFSTQTRIYKTQLTADFSILRKDGSALAQLAGITATKNVVLNSNDTFKTSPLVEAIKDSLRKEIVDKIIDFLFSTKTQGVVKRAARG